MRIVFMGTPDFSVGTLEALVEAGHEIAGVVTQPDKPKGRGKAMQATPVKEAALAHGLTVYQPARVREPGFVEELRRLEPEAIVVVAFGQIIPKSILELPPLGCINVHASLLPKYRGAAPIQWAVIDGEEVSGVTIMRMDTGLDTGDMLAKTEVRLEPEETGGTLFEKLSRAGAALLTETLPKLAAGEIRPQKQPAESPNAYARMITKADGEIDWKKDAEELERLIRGLNPWPSAFTFLDGKTFKIWKASVCPEEDCGGDACPAGGEGSRKIFGSVEKTDKDGIYVRTGKGLLRLLEVQLEGKKRMDCAAFLRGVRLEKGTVLGKG